MSVIRTSRTAPCPPRRRASTDPSAARSSSWLRANLFATIPSSIVTLLILLVLGKALFSLVQWGFLNAVFSVPDSSNTAACRAVKGLGACWAVIPEKLRFILFGTYPFDQQWRPAAAVLIFIALFFVTSRRWAWRKELALVWAARWR